MPFLALAPALIGAAAQIGGGFMSAAGAASANAQAQAQNQSMFNQSQAFNLGQAEEARRLQNEQFYNNLQFQSEQAERAMGWTEIMSNTAYQRAMKDMRAAGLNPMLAYQQGGAGSGAGQAGGGGGGSPSSASVSGSGAPVQNTQEELGRAVGRIASSAVDTYRSGEQAKLLGSQRELTDEGTRKVGYETKLLDASEGKVLAETNTEKQRADMVKAQTEAAKAASAHSYANAANALKEGKNLDTYGARQAPDTIERILRIIQGDIGKVHTEPKEW